MGKDYDFSGWATRNDLLCGDGRTIRKNAFKDNDGVTVPLIWNHDHKNIEAVVGHALLENRDEGVYAYCKLNDTEKGQLAKKLVVHGDVRSLSIWANKLKQIGNDVIHGKIRELSLVLAGANPGATVDFVMAHSDDEDGDELFANYDESALILYHSAENNTEKGEEEVAEETKTIKEVFETLNEEQKQAVYALIGQALENGSVEDSAEEDEEDVKHSDEDDDETEEETEETSEELTEDSEDSEEELEHADEEKTVGEVFDTLNEEQKQAVYAMIGAALEENEDEEVEHSEGGEETMKVNVFDEKTKQTSEVLSHDAMNEILEDAKRCGSLKEAVLSHGIEDIEIMFPDAKALNAEPEFIKRNDDWVAKVLGGVHHSPFARIKTIFADITSAQARAKGYQKGKLKLEEVFKLLKRITNPTTVYKKQALDRDDILDVNFNVLPWLKREIRMMLDEELARAILIGDGRDPVEEADDKIDEECIRPIWKMEDLFTVKVAIETAADATAEDKAKAFIKACVKSRKEYKGSGNPDMFMSEDMLTDCLLIEDMNGRVIYDTVAKLAATLRVREIIPVPVMEGLSRGSDDGSNCTYDLAGIYVNLKDYNVGTDKGGEINFFDDFDIDYNKQKYLMETRCSGTLVKPQSAVALEFVIRK